MLTIRLTELLTKEFNPKFLNYDIFHNNINIVISSNCFINQPIAERIRSIYSCLEKNIPEVFETHSIFVHTFTQEELKEVLKTHSEEGT
jgi:stress-induced morphogen